MNELRNAYLEEIVASVYDGEDIYLVAADLAAPCLDRLREDFPQRYVPVGIAEQNLVAVSSGLALTGKKVVAYTLNPFLVFRAFDQIHNSLCHINLPVALVGLSAGFSSNGFTHYILEDVSILRGLPNLEIYNVSDINLAKFLAKKTLSLENPMYVRIDRTINQTHDLSEEDIRRGWRFFHRAAEKKIFVAATGILASHCLEILNERPDLSEKVSLADVFAFPFDKKSLADELKNYSRVITVEELRLQGGMGSAVLETLSEEGISLPVERLGVDMTKNFSTRYGSRDWHLRQCGLDKNSIAEKISGALGVRD